MTPTCASCEWYRPSHPLGLLWFCALDTKTALQTELPATWQWVRPEDACPAFVQRQAMLLRRA